VRIVTLEEHFTIPALTAKIDPEAIARRGWQKPGSPQAAPMPHEALADLGPNRIADMDQSGVTLQVLSLAGPGADLADTRQGPALAREFNDRLHDAIRSHPDRYAAFAHLPTTAPAAAADELERTVRELGFKGALINGVTDGRFLDDPAFEPLLARAEQLDVPIYIHPGLPPMEVRRAYYDRLPLATGDMLARAGWGWHSELAVHVLRLVLSGALDRHPKLKLIIGHMGEGLPAMLDRCDEVFGQATPGYLSRTVSRTILDQVWITTSGFFSLVPFTAAMATFGADRILFSIDYPFASNREGVDFLNRLPVSDADLQKIAHGNADALLKLKTSAA
jgi:predicted TIM-barrel fold metal-dependent hydrolase